MSIFNIEFEKWSNKICPNQLFFYYLTIIIIILLFYYFTCSLALTKGPRTYLTRFISLSKPGQTPKLSLSVSCPFQFASTFHATSDVVGPRSQPNFIQEEKKRSGLIKEKKRRKRKNCISIPYTHMCTLHYNMLIFSLLLFMWLLFLIFYIKFLILKFSSKFSLQKFIIIIVIIITYCHFSYSL